jgi:hypothetical protein
MQRGCGRTLVLLLLTPMMTLNVSQAMTLCVSGDGRTAIELVIGGRCTCELPPSGASDDGGRVSGPSHLMDGRSLSCTDMSVPVGSCNGRTAPGTAKAGFASPVATPPLPPPATIDARETAFGESPPLLACYSVLLDSIILRV